MNTNLTKNWRWLLAVGSTLLFLGCLDETNGTNAAPDTSAVVESAAPQPDSSEREPSAPLRDMIPPADLSPGVAEVVKLIQSGVGEEVLLAYLEKSGHEFNPTVDEIVYLKDLGLSETVLATLVREGKSKTATARAPEEKPAAETNLAWPATNAPPAPSMAEGTAPSYSVEAAPGYSESATTAPPQQVTINYFEQSLAPYGRWIEVADYGRCWQPTVVAINPSWRPYGDRGRWIYTTAGWYWQSDYSWGWAPFHYGRWYCDNRAGWVWFPGSVWAPSWVSWRYTDSYCGWAPLPPTAYYDGFGFRYHNSRVGFGFDFGLHDDFYTFVPTSRFCDRYPYRYYLPRSRAKEVYQHSVVANHYRRGNDHTVINEGIGRNRIAEVTRTAIRPVPLRDLPTTTTPVGRAERLEGNSLTVFRPSPAAQAMLARRSIGTRTIFPTQTTPNPQTPSPSSLPGSGPQDRILLTQPSRSQTTAPNTTQNQQPATATTPFRSTGQTFLRNPNPSETRSSQPANQEHASASANAGKPSATASPRATPTPQETSPRRSGSTTLRQLPTQAPQERSRSFGGSAGNVAPSPNFPTAPSSSAPITRSQPGNPPVQREQPVVRETRRQEVPSRDSGTQPFLRSLPSQPQAAPIQRQPTFTAPPVRSVPSVPNTVERPPTLSAPATPAPSYRAQPPSSTREAERSGRFDRRGS